MKQMLKRLLYKTPFYFPMRKWWHQRRQAKKIREWESKGCPPPPPHNIKLKILKEYADKFGLQVFVETGTAYGDMTDAMNGSFDQIYSIELASELFQIAKQRFKNAKHINIIQGDSGVELNKIMKEISIPTLFWLDAHYSSGVTARGEKDTPIYEELEHILAQKGLGHVILIDDARCFGKDPAYPTIDELINFVLSINDKLDINVELDGIRITPQIEFQKQTSL
ncbi:hypothetical protein ACFLZW_00555 [Chloroflexota bacterium]